MSLRTFQRLRHAAEQEGVLFCFDGELSHAAVAGVGKTVRARMAEAAVPLPVARRLFSAIVELAQNVVHYAADGGLGEAKHALLAIGHRDGAYWAAGANRVDARQAHSLKARFVALQAMTSGDIEAAYRRKLDDERHEQDEIGSRGAGLGLLTLARHASAPLEFALEPLGEGDFQLQICARLDGREHPGRSP